MGSQASEVVRKIETLGYKPVEKIGHNKMRFQHPNGALLTIPLSQTDPVVPRTLIKDAEIGAGLRARLNPVEKHRRSLMKAQNSQASAWRTLQSYAKVLDINLNRRQCVLLIQRYGSYRGAKNAVRRMYLITQVKENHDPIRQGAVINGGKSQRGFRSRQVDSASATLSGVS